MRKNNILNWIKLSSFIFALSSLFASCSNDIDETLQPAGNGTLQFVVGDFPAFGESGLTRAIGTQDEGKTAWENGDQILVTLTSQKYGEQAAALTYDGSSWSTEASLSYLENETPIVSVFYAPCYEVTEEGTMQLRSGMQLGMTEYLFGNYEMENGIMTITFEGAIRTYNRLRIATVPEATLTVTTTDFTPAGATEVATAAYTLTADDKGNAYLYGTFAKDATVTVMQGDVIRVSYPFTAETEQGKSYALDARPVIDLSQYSEGEIVEISSGGRIIGDGNEYNLTLNITADATVIFDVRTSGVNLGGSITVSDGKTLTLLVEGNAEHTVKGGISFGNGSNVIIEGDLTQENNKLTVTSSDGNAGIGANGGVIAGDITIRNARVDATGSSREAPELSTSASISGAAIGTSDGSMGDILIENSIIVAEGGYYESTSHAAAIGIGYVGSTMGNITLKDSQITARNNGDGLASVIGAGANMHVDVTGTLGDIVITNTELNLSMEIGTTHCYAALIGLGVGKSYAYVNMGKIIFTDMKQEELDKVIPTWLPSDFNQYGAYALGRGYDGCAYKKETFGGVWVSDGNGNTVQIGNENGYYCLNEA
ncbi:MAG: hypothetical protein II267_06600, partial [Paludibacteraceae bacterium]|nr:hypothetical protein [Paludibacteraceae bacterium]